jgi:ribosome-associated protein
VNDSESLPAHDDVLLWACQAAKIADDLRAGEIVVIDLRGITSVCDFFVIATGGSSRLMRAVVEEINKRFKKEAWPPLGLEGARDDHWILADYGDIVVHVFQPDARELSDLEGLWADAPRVDWHEVLGLEKDRGL